MPQDNPAEMFVEVDEADQEIGLLARQVAHQDPQRIHRAIYVLVVNSQNQMLFQKRSQTKDLYAGMWSPACAGHVTYGETYQEAAVKELKEELGLTGQLFYVTNILVKTPQETEYCQIYMCKTPDEIKIDPTEIESIQWVEIPAIGQFVKDHPLPP